MSMNINNVFARICNDGFYAVNNLGISQWDRIKDFISSSSCRSLSSSYRSHSDNGSTEDFNGELQKGEWQMGSGGNYFLVKGEASCSNIEHNWGVATVPSNSMTNSVTGSNCWCKMTAYQDGFDATMTIVSDAPWVYVDGWNTNENCAWYCASYCHQICSSRYYKRDILGITCEQCPDADFYIDSNRTQLASVNNGYVTTNYNIEDITSCRVRGANGGGYYYDKAGEFTTSWTNNYCSYTE